MKKTFKRMVTCIFSALLTVNSVMPAYANEQPISEPLSSTLNVSVIGSGQVKVTENGNETVVTTETPFSQSYAEGTNVKIEAIATEGNVIENFTNNDVAVPEFVAEQNNLKIEYVTGVENSNFVVTFKEIVSSEEQETNEKVDTEPIEQTPEDEISELELIMSDNHQRNFSEEDKRIIIQNYEKIYKYHKLKDKELDKAIKNAENPMQVTVLEEQRRIPKGMEKRDWIAQKTGFTNRNGTPLTGRQIQTYLTGEFSGKAQETKPKEKVVSQEELEQKEVLGTLKKYLVEITDAKISITPTKLSIGYANLYDLNRILQTLKTDNELDHITKTYLKTKRG